MPQFPQGYFLKTIYIYNISSVLLTLHKSNWNLASNFIVLAFVLREFNFNTFFIWITEGILH